MNQTLARLAFYLLAPTSDDGLVTWNLLDELLGSGREGVSDTEKEIGSSRSGSGCLGRRS